VDLLPQPGDRRRLALGNGMAYGDPAGLEAVSAVETEPGQDILTRGGADFGK
jgi:hypothetical protein